VLLFEQRAEQVVDARDQEAIAEADIHEQTHIRRPPVAPDNRLWGALVKAAPIRAIDADRRPLRALRKQRRAVRADRAEVVGIFQAEVQRAIAAHAQPADET